MASQCTRWRHQMETFFALLVICAGNSLVPGEFPTQRPVTRSFDVFFDLRLDKRLSKQPWGWWFRRYRAHCDGIVISTFNRFWSKNAIWRHITWSILVDGLTAPSHYLNQFWPSTRTGIWYSPEGRFHRKCSRYISLIWVSELKIIVTFPGVFLLAWINFNPNMEK